MTRGQTNGIPWPTGTIDDAISAIETGTSPKTLDRPVIGNERGVLKVSAVTWHEFRAHESKALPPDFDTTGIPTVRKGDLLLSRANTAELLASPVLVQDDHPTLILSDKTLRLVPRPTVDPRFLLYALRQPEARHFFLSNATGTSGSMRNVSQDTIRRCPIPLPPLSEQKRIADILDKADAIRRKRQEAINVFGDLTAAVFNDMFSEQLTSVDWTDLGDFVEELRYGTSNKSGETGFTTLRIPNVVRGIIDLGELKTVCVSDNEFGNLKLIDGDILFVRTNGNPDYVGRCAVFQPSQIEAAGLDADEIIYASYLIRARLKLDRLRPAFLQSFLQTSSGRRNVRDKCRTSAGQYNINTKGITSLRVPKIPIDEQIEFAKRISASQPALTKLTAAESETSNLFNSLFQRAFKGEM